MPKLESADATLRRADGIVPVELLDEALRVWGDAMNANIAGRIEHWERHGLTTGQLRLMTTLRDHGEPMPLGELAQILGVSPATMTGITTRLVRRHLIERVPDAGDRRVIRVALTEQGARAMDEVREPARAFYKQILSGLGRKRTEQFISVLGDFVSLAATIRRAQVSENGARPADGRRPSATARRGGR